jgi:hypothetical protein
MWEVAEDRFRLSDWKELYNDIEEGVYSWQRDTADGLKSTKIQMTLEGKVPDLLKVLAVIFGMVFLTLLAHSPLLFFKAVLLGCGRIKLGLLHQSLIWTAPAICGR